MDEALAAVHEAFAAAGLEAPADPLGLPLESLDERIEDKRLRARCKSALMKYRKAAGEGHAPAEAAPAPAAEAAPAPAEAAPELAERLEAVQAAFAAAGLEPPADPLAFDPASLDDRVEDKKLRAQCKSALAKLRKLSAAGEAQAPAAAAAAPAAPRDPFAVPQGDPAELWLLTPDGWTRLGTATRQPSLTDELVGQAAPGGATRRITSILILDGVFFVPDDLYNTFCFLAHEGVVYKAYYLSHVGDTKKGTRTASLKVDETYTPDEFAAAYAALGAQTRPTADDIRRHRFGGDYDTDRRMFASLAERLL